MNKLDEDLVSRECAEEGRLGGIEVWRHQTCATDGPGLPIQRISAVWDEPRDDGVVQIVGICESGMTEPQGPVGGR